MQPRVEQQFLQVTFVAGRFVRLHQALNAVFFGEGKASTIDHRIGAVASDSQRYALEVLLLYQ